MPGRNVTAEMYGTIKYGPKRGKVESAIWDSKRQCADIVFIDEHGHHFETTALGMAASEIRDAVAHALMTELLRP